MESQPKNPEFRINPENFHPYFMYASSKGSGETAGICSLV